MHDKHIAVRCDAMSNPVLGEIKNLLGEVTFRVRCKGCVEIIQGSYLEKEEHLESKRTADNMKGHS